MFFFKPLKTQRLLNFLATPFQGNPTFRLILFCLLLCYTGPASAQIQNADGSPVTRDWCNEDTMHQVVGLPLGGTFSGCGVVNVGGDWYFNPELATAGSTASTICTLTYTPPGGGTPITASISIKPKIQVTVVEDQITCDGYFYISGDEQPVGDYKRYWSPGADLEDSTRKGTSGYTNRTQTYVYTCYHPYYGCTGRDTVTVFYEGVEAVLEQSKDTVCVGEPVDFVVALEDSTYAYRWLSGDGREATNTLAWQVAYDEAGNYEPMLIVSNAYCSDTAIGPVSVRDFDIRLTASSTLVEKRDLVSLETSADEPYTVTAWEPTHLFNDQHALRQTISADSTCTYVVKGMSAYGCEDSAEILISVIPTVFVPSSFTPNGDGRNDFFRVAQSGILTDIRDFRVYDRWGKEVWAGTGAEAVTGWDGSYNGTPAAVGVYYYYVEIETVPGTVVVKQGDVTLLR
jgi:gliding motility-associated-like protein